MQDTPRWIASSLIGDAKTSPPAPYFRKSFQLDGPVKQATARITALGLFECEINGQPVTEDTLVPGWTEYRKRVPLRSYDITSLLRPGANAVGVVLGDGWYCGHVAERPRQQYGQRPQLWLELAITLENGTVQKIVSDGSWKTSAGPILSNDIMSGETYDARKELPQWSAADGDDKGWQAAVLAEDPKIILDSSPGPAVRRHEILPAKKIASGPKTAANATLYDLAQNFTGRTRIRVKGKAGAKITVRHGEVLDAEGDLYTENLRTARATDIYILKGGEAETWEPRFTFHGFRFVEVAIEGEAVLEKIEGVVVHSEMPLTGTFRCSNPLLNQLEHNILWGQKSNFLEVPTDCPQRDERLGWTGDAQVFIRTAAFHMDVRGFFHKWLRDMRDAQDADGAVPPFVPNTHSFDAPPDGGPAWADAVFICPWVVYRHYNDLDVLRDNYECMARYLDYLAASKVKDGIRNHPDLKSHAFGDWLALDGSGLTVGATPFDLIGTAFYAHNAWIMAQTAQLLGRAADVKKYEELHGRIVQAFRRRFVTPEGLLASGTQTSYVLALHFDLVPEEVRANTARELVRLIEQNTFHIGTGFVGTPYILHVLEATGHLDVAYKLLEQETFPSWLFPVKNGATTIWERWDGWTPDKGFQSIGMNSFNHYAYGAVGDWMVSSVAGLEIAEPGYRKILFKPRPGGTLTSAEAKLKTPQGETSISWELKGDQLHLDLLVPEKSEATLSLAEGWKAKVTSLQAGRHHLVATK